MAYQQYNDLYRREVLLGRLPLPIGFFYPYANIAPNLFNPGCDNCYYGSLVNSCLNYNAQCIPCGPCADPFDPQYNGYCNNIGPYCDTIPYQDPSVAMCFSAERLVSNIPIPAIAPPAIVNGPDQPVATRPPIPPAPIPWLPPHMQSVPVVKATTETSPNGLALPPLSEIARNTSVIFPVPPARNYDPNLLDPWGILVVNDIVWVASSGSGLLISYNLLGKPLLPVVNVFGPLGNIAQPTGLVHNESNAFQIINGARNASSAILIATRDGTINGYNADVDPDNSMILIDNSNADSVYTGLEIVGTVLYVTDFYNRRIDVFNGNLNPITDYPFIDEFSGDPIPDDFSPFNIVNIGDFLYVLYARQNPLDNQYELEGTGNGYISIFTLTGEFVKRFISRGPLNVPWGLLLAPTYFGYPAGSIMVANFGNNTISIFDPNGKFIGNIMDRSLNNICIGGIRGLAFNPNYLRLLYWTASDNNYRDAFMGTINSRFII